MTAIIYALVFGVFLGWLSTDAQTPWLKVIGYLLTVWMFLAAILAAVRMTADSEE